MNEYFILIFIILSVLSLFFQISELIKIDNINDDDIYTCNFKGLIFNFSKKYIEEVNSNLFLNKFYKKNESIDEKFDYIIFEKVFIIPLIILCLCECFIPILIFFFISLIHLFSNLRLNFNNNKFFPINHEGIILMKYIIDILLFIITSIMLISAIHNKYCNCLCFKKKRNHRQILSS